MWIALLLPTLVLAQPLRVGVYHNPPKLFIDDQGQPSGILWELLEAIASQEAWRLDPVDCRWQACLEALVDERLDLLPDVAWSQARSAQLAFHREPALHSWSQIYQRPGTALDAIPDLDGKRVAVLQGSIQQTYLENLGEGFGITLDLLAVDTYAAGFEATLAGQVEAVVANRHFGDWQARQLGLSATPIMFQPARLFYAAPAGRKASVLAAIDEHLIAWKPTQNTPYHEILERWSVRNDDQFRIPEWLWWSLGGLTAMLALALVGNMLLRRRVAERTTRLAASEQRLAAILDSVEAFIFIKTPDLRYTYVNRKVCELLNRSATSILGHRDEEFFDADTAARLRANDLRVIEGGEKVTDEETNLLPRGGKPHVFLSVKLPLYDARGEVVSLCGISTDITEYREIQESNRLLANFNPVTGLPNRQRFMDKLTQAILNTRHRHPFIALLLIDLDHFKLVNDLHSHEAGDRLLRHVAQRLGLIVDDTDTLAHLGDDEFALLIDNLAPPLESAAHRIEQLGERLLAAVQRNGGEEDTPTITASLGLTLFSRHDVEPGGAMQQADIALAQAKAAGGNTLRFFNDQMQVRVMERVRLERDLQRALQRDEFRLCYQLKVDTDERPVGVEALIRWQHPERGLIPPVEFIPLAEQSQLILAIGQWVVETACEVLSRWADDEAREQLSMAVNVSAVQFHDPGFVSQIKAVLAESGAPAERLMLEVTESVLMEEPESVRNTLAALRELGIRLALDDFGTGYSSLNYLKRLPLDELKIDRSFILGIPHDASDTAIVETTLTLATHLGLDVVAEGVENDAQFQWLKARGCRVFQGYRFGKPVELESLALAATSA
ncbi:diguanylate cyclase [Halomonas urumqiensis]|uniref:cyclic-guanylate-specific phosphodiesterase n=1 Tax=Halomonas urumqiensis TaxID=1684789 RepID=A0A2N7UDU6_9GAMM|nr:diguanylate cyclase [Halomonas urumqiensis]PTB04273.1 PAS domain S-box protein [Halomonas urumqiensis]